MENDADERIAALDQFDKTLGELQQAVKDLEMRRQQLVRGLPPERAWVARTRRYDSDWAGQEWWYSSMLARSRGEAWKMFAYVAAAFNWDVREVTLHEGRPDAYKAWEKRIVEGYHGTER